ncbi:DUF4333 domain-containing protein [Mycolicibacterium llatzerense]|uniref:DUF4333 domain-containing protein n=1 Tax=Mycolicibacterium llatzerense TaxID=280871 RepID=UPI0008DC95E7|nr:DUF4333 domain-containing protein [Mycolicibacterium llatzerense]
MVTTARLGLILCALALGTTACHSTVTIGPSTTSRPAAPTGISKTDLERDIGQQIKAQHPDQPVDLSCPAGLPMRNGASEQCVLTSGADQYPVTLTVSGVGTDAGGSVDWQIGHKVPAT